MKKHKWIRPVAWFLIGLIVGIGIITLWYCYSSTTIEKQDKYDPWLLANYLFNILGAIGTLLAVIVALAKEAIMKWLYSPDLQVTLADNGIIEIIDENQKVPEASSFECHINIENNGSLAAFGCKAYISEIKYGKTKEKAKAIKPLKNEQMTWMSSSEVDMPVGIPSKIKLFDIMNPNRLGTPQPEDNNQKPQISFNGCDLNNLQIHNGYWMVDYFISCKNGEASKFVVTIEWNGEFKSRATDMEDVLIVKIEKK
ncbi:MAG: hypothetical protein IKO34_05895 [Bacteroidales bacterium]|jgi:hypothetical protein|nr:hypothetical protein [Bacteroidales bacterium]